MMHKFLTFFSSIVSLTHDGTKVLYNTNLQDIDQGSPDTSIQNPLDFDPMFDPLSACPLCPPNSDMDDSFSDNDTYC